MKKVPENDFYLRAPLFTSRSRSKDFKYLQDKLETRLTGWRSKNLSWASRCTLIKFVAQALPTYSFSTFDVPTVGCDKLDAMTRRFWWNPKKVSGRFLAWKSWDHLCTSKNNGGLGFRKAKKFNEVYIAKLTWMIASKRNSPCMVALRSKYKVTNSWLREEPRKFSSHTWRAVERVKILITKRACFLIGNGGSIDIWKEPWVPGYIARPKSLTTNYLLLKVADLIDPINNCWFEEKLLELFDEESINAIKRIVIPTAPSLDKLVWILDAKGKFSVKSTFNINHAPVQIVDESLWSQL